jgi:uncharacterized protein YlxW (UPF0749 family)
MIMVVLWLVMCASLVLVSFVFDTEKPGPVVDYKAVSEGVAKWEAKVGFNELANAIKKYQSAIDDTKTSKQTVLISQRLCPSEITVVIRALGRQLY